jgi:4-nitrophenyl phosphatase
MRAAGFSLVAADADVVVVGLDPDLTYQKLAQAMQLIRGGARFIGTNGDRTFPLPDRLVPGAGSILAALQACTDQKPLIIGKPEKPMFEIALDRLGTPAGRTLMVGDRLDTDILGGQQAGLRTALLLTGVTTPEALATGSVRPDCVFDDLKALHAAWAAARRARV